MKTLRPRLVAVLAAVAALCLSIRAADKPEPTPKPRPSWVKIIDQGDLNPRLKGYKTPEGVKVEIVAEEPTVISPSGLTFADDGTPYVLTRGEVKALTDSKGTGVFDTSKMVLQDEAASGVLFHDGWLYVAGRGSARRYKQRNGEGLFFLKEVVAEGFGSDGARQASGMTMGLDGRLYLTASEGDNLMKGSDGSAAAVLRSGAVFRCRPDGSKLETFAIGFVNPHGNAAFDPSGNLFVADGRAEGARDFGNGRLTHVAEGSDFGWRLKAGAKCCQADPVRAGGGAEGPPPSDLGPGSPNGLFVYGDTRFPESYRGLLFCPDAVNRSIHAYKVDRKGATFAVAEEFDLLQSDDPLFRPRQALTGPDGAIYVVDERVQAGAVTSDDGKRGRIYRITWAGTKDEPALPPRDRDIAAKLAKLEDDDLLKALVAEESGDLPRRELIRRGEKERPALLKLFQDSEQPDGARIAALSALGTMWDGDVQAAAIELLTKESSADVRRLSADALGLNAVKGDDNVHDGLLRALTDNAPEVRRSAALAMSRVAAAGAADVLVNTYAFDDGRDPVLRDGLVRAIENLGKPGVSRLGALGESGVQKETDKVVEAFAMFRTRAGADAVPLVLENPHLKPAQRIALLRSYNNYLLDPPVSLAPVLDYLTAHPDEAVMKGAIQSLGGDIQGAQFLGQAFVDKKLPPEALADVAAVLKEHAKEDRECAELLAAVMKAKVDSK